MDGVTILSSVERNVKGGQIALLIVGIVVVVVFLTALIISVINDGETSIVWGFLLGIGVVMIIISSCNLKEGQYTEYKVLIDDSVSMTEFHEKYEVIDRDGLIYIVKETNNG